MHTSRTNVYRSGANADPDETVGPRAWKTVRLALERLISGMAKLLATYDAVLNVTVMNDGEPADVARLRAEIAADDRRTARAMVRKLVTDWLGDEGMQHAAGGTAAKSRPMTR